MSTVKWGDLTARERDALIAERVMGLRVRRKVHVGGVEVVWVARPGFVGERVLPCYTTAIAAAWEVVERHHADNPDTPDSLYGWCVHVNQDSIGEWLVTFWCGNSNHDGHAPAAPEAICLAALRAVGVEVHA